jgi:hypothetical protein
MKQERSYFKNMELINTHDLNKIPAFQMAYQVVKGRHYLYCSLWYGAGFHIVDVSDPKNLKQKFVPDPRGKPGTVTPKVQVADGIMIIGAAQRPKFLNDGQDISIFDGGIQIYDVQTDPWNPKLLSVWDCSDGDCFSGTGTHRNFYAGGRYAHLSASCRNFTNNIYRIVDIADPKNPVEAGRWWLKEQFAGGMEATTEGGPYHLHMPMVRGDRAYLAYCGYGLIILDISDVTRPKFVGGLRTKPPFNDGISLHTAQPLSTNPNLILISSEHSRKEQIGFAGIVDVSDETKPALVSIFPTYDIPEGASYKNYYDKPGSAGPHNWHSPQGQPDLEDRPDRLYHTCFNGGLRVYDFSDPYLPKEIASFIPDDPAEALDGHKMRGHGDIIACCEDVLVDKRGYIFVVDSNGGLYILRCTV